MALKLQLMKELQGSANEVLGLKPDRFQRVSLNSSTIQEDEVQSTLDQILRLKQR